MAEIGLLEACQLLDYVELPVAKALMDADDQFRGLAVALRSSGLAAHAANVFLPSTLRVVGPDARLGELADYAVTALDRAQQLGITMLVFGSGASRHVPGGFSRADALDQFESAVRTVHREAIRRGVTLALEPLHSEETNLLNTVGEGADFIRERQLTGVRLVADLWHMECEREPLDALGDAGDLVAHAHVAAADRRAPGQAADRIEPFLRQLRESDYAGACSIECRWSDMARELPGAVARVREAAEAAGMDVP